ncbi:unnamed protein product [Rhodiola kirilowii]
MPTVDQKGEDGDGDEVATEEAKTEKKRRSALWSRRAGYLMVRGGQKSKPFVKRRRGVCGEMESSSPGWKKRKYLMVIGINTAFSSRKRRDALRSTWKPQGDKRRKLEKEKGIVIRFVIGHSSASGGILDRAIVVEDEKHDDMLRLDHIEGYMEMSAKTKSYFATAVVLWDAEFYVKVDDDVHVNIATLGEALSRQRKKKMVYVGCMKSGQVIAQKGVRYHEPQRWKFGEKYFRHATGQIYAISKDLAVYISVNQ